LSNVKILSRGNISMITAGAGVGKSSLLEAGCTSIIQPMGGDTLGLRFNTKNCLYIDTERSLFDTHISWQRCMKRGGVQKYDTIPESIKWENIRAIESLEDRLKYLIAKISDDNTPELIIIDGIGDFVADPNNSNECTTLISKLCSIVHNRNIGILLTLHNNPAINDQKACGVLGSELWRKCESSLIIKKLGSGVRMITTNYLLGKNRSGSDTVQSTFKWSDEEKMFVSCSAPVKEATKGKTFKNRELVLEKMGEINWAYNNLVKMIVRDCGMADSTAKRTVKDLTTAGCIEKMDNGLYHKFSVTQVPEWCQNGVNF
jgi:hypothetical protein